MKRLALFLVLACVSQIDVKAQKTYAFFDYSHKSGSVEYKFYEEKTTTNSLAETSDNVPVGSGMLLLSAMGIAYCVGKKHRR